MMIVVITVCSSLLHCVLAHRHQHRETHILHANMQRTCQFPLCYSYAATPAKPVADAPGRRPAVRLD
uniref:Putative secreted protein n=1 Tax=Anopheles darlingi TaxID=43151 RepID=A0A2M4DG33_ANODA